MRLIDCLRLLEKRINESKHFETLARREITEEVAKTALYLFYNPKAGMVPADVKDYFEAHKYEEKSEEFYHVLEYMVQLLDEDSKILRKPNLPIVLYVAKLAMAAGLDKQEYHYKVKHFFTADNSRERRIYILHNTAGTSKAVNVQKRIEMLSSYLELKGRTGAEKKYAAVGVSEKYYKKHADINKPLVIEGKVSPMGGDGADVNTADGFELCMLLTDYIGKQVRVTVEVIEEEA